MILVLVGYQPANDFASCGELYFFLIAVLGERVVEESSVVVIDPHSGKLALSYEFVDRVVRKLFKW